MFLERSLQFNHLSLLPPPLPPKNFDHTLVAFTSYTRTEKKNNFGFHQTETAAITSCRKQWNFSFILSNVVVDIVRVRIRFILKLTFELSKSESLRNLSVTRMSDTFPTVFHRLIRTFLSFHSVSSSCFAKILHQRSTTVLKPLNATDYIQSIALILSCSGTLFGL